MSYVGWSLREYDEFFELRTKANLWNLQEAKRLIDLEIEKRAKIQILTTYYEDEHV